MNYENPIIPHEEIPQFAEVPLQPIEQVYKKVQFISAAITFLFTILGIVSLFILIDKLQKEWIIGITLGLLFILIAFSYLSIQIGFKNKAWAIREKDIIFKKGWLFHTTHIIPFIKVQHCVVRSGPIERKYGLASIRLMTAASHDVDISIHGLKKETADQLKLWIMEKIELNASEGI